MDGDTTRARVAVPGRDTVLSDRYRLHHLIGAGGMGSVWEAEDLVLHRSVAVKLLQDIHAGDPVAAARFEREAQTAARLSHPNLAVVYDYGGADDVGMFLVMELLAGETLAQRLRGGALPATEAAAVMAEAAEALAAAHAQGVVHRDVKPANLMLTPIGMKVLDFGIAASGTSAPLTATGMIIGTAPYLAPERVQGRSATPASDVYALGAVLFEALAGRPAFEGDTPAEVALGHVHRPVPDLSVVDPTVPAILAAACRDTLAKDPTQRPTAEDLARRLRRAATDGSASATDSQPRTAVLAAAPAAAPLSPRPARAGRGRLVIVTSLAAAVLATVGLIAYGLSSRDSPDAATPGASTVTATPAAAVVTTAPPEPAAPTTATPTTPPTTAAPTTVAPSALTPVDLETALADAAVAYLAALGAGDLEGAWARTSPEFQDQQDRASWESFWSGFDSIEVTGPAQVEGRSGRVTVPLSFDGRSERYRMVLVEGPTGWLVDGPVGRERGRSGDSDDSDDSDDDRG